MKKFMFVFAAMIAMSFASCGNGTKAADAVDSTVVDSVEVVDSVLVADSLAADTVQVAE